MAEGTGVEPASDKCAVVFETTALPVRLPFQEEFRIADFGFRSSRLALCSGLAGTLGFEPRISILETDGLPVSLHPSRRLVHVVGLAPTKDNEVRLIYSQVLLLLSHTCAHGIQISNLTREVSN